MNISAKAQRKRYVPALMATTEDWEAIANLLKREAQKHLEEADQARSIAALLEKHRVHSLSDFLE